MIRRLLSLFIPICVLLLAISCATPTAAPTPTSVAATPTLAPTPTTATAVDSCTGCHREKATLEKLAVKKVEKSEETQGEG